MSLSFKQSSLYKQYFGKSSDRSSANDSKPLFEQSSRPTSPFQRVEKNETFINKLFTTEENPQSPLNSRSNFNAKLLGRSAESVIGSPQQQERISRYAANEIIHETQKQLWEKERAQLRERIKGYESMERDYQKCKEDLIRCRSRNQILEREYNSLRRKQSSGSSALNNQLIDAERSVDANSYVYNYDPESSDPKRVNAVDNLNIGTITSRLTIGSPMIKLSPVSEKAEETEKFAEDSQPQKYRDSKQHPIWDFHTENGIGFFSPRSPKREGSFVKAEHQKELQNQIFSLQEQKKKLEAKIDDFKLMRHKGLKNFKTLRDSQEKELEILRAAKRTLKSKVDEMMRVSSSGHEKHKELKLKLEEEQRRNHKLLSENEQLAEELKFSERKLTKARQRLEAQQKISEEETDRIRNKLKQVSSRSMEEELMQTEALRKRLFLEKDTLEEELKRLRRQNQSLRRQAQKLKCQSEELKINQSSQQGVLTKLNVEYLNVSEASKALMAQKQSLSGIVEELKSTLLAKGQEIVDLKQLVQNLAEEKRIAIIQEKGNALEHIRSMEGKIDTQNLVISQKVNELSKQRADIEGLLREIVRLRGVTHENSKLKELYRYNVQKDEGIEHLWDIKEAEYQKIMKILSPFHSKSQSLEEDCTNIQDQKNQTVGCGSTSKQPELVSQDQNP